MYGQLNILSSTEEIQMAHFYDSHGWADVIDLNYDSPELRTAMIQAMQFWVETCQIDGFRCDMAMLVPIDFWKEARRTLDNIKPLFWLAECEEIMYHEVFDASYTWKMVHMMESFWKKSSDMQGLIQVLYYYSHQFPASCPTGLLYYQTTMRIPIAELNMKDWEMQPCPLPFSVASMMACR